MAKARTTLTMSITVKLPVGINAADMMNFVRGRLTGTPHVIVGVAPIDQEKIEAAVNSEETKVSLVKKLTEYK